MSKALNLLGLSKKAGFLEIGEESVSICIERSKARLLLSAADASAGSKRKAAYLSEEYNLPHVILPFTKAELSGMIGRGAPGILAVTDIGFAAGFAARLAEEDAAYAELAARFAVKKKRADERRAARKSAAKNEKQTNGKGRKYE